MIMQLQQLAERNTSLEEDNSRWRRERSELSGRLSTTKREVGGCDFVYYNVLMMWMLPHPHTHTHTHNS